jgi:hypothetical protein
MPELLNVTIFLTFIILLFGILGLQNNMGNLYGKCRTTIKPLNATYWPSLDNKVCSDSIGLNTCPSGTICGFPIEYDITLSQDGVYNNPQINYGIASF